jgi:DNA-binding NarL/FixJ family response regulator
MRLKQKQGKVMTNILIVDDNRAFRKILRGIIALKIPSVHIRELPDGKTALKETQKEIPDLIFMDIQLPGENGFKLTKRIKKAHPEIQVIIMTSYDSPEYREAAVEAGADHFMPKHTSTPEDIMEKVGSIL